MSEKKPRSYDEVKREKDMEEKISELRDKAVNGLKNTFSLKTTRQKVTKIGLAGLFMAVALPYGAIQMTEQEMNWARIAQKEVVTETQSNTTKELFRLEEMRDVTRNNEVVGREPHLVDEHRVVNRQIKENTRHMLEIDGRRYEVRPALGGLSRSQAEDLWKNVRQGSRYDFTVARTITGDRIVTGYTPPRSSYYGW